jgi:hypothetical protein
MTTPSSPVFPESASAVARAGPDEPSYQHWADADASPRKTRPPPGRTKEDWCPWEQDQPGLPERQEMIPEREPP